MTHAEKVNAIVASSLQDARAGIVEVDSIEQYESDLRTELAHCNAAVVNEMFAAVNLHTALNRN